MVVGRTIAKFIMGTSFPKENSKMKDQFIQLSLDDKNALELHDFENLCFLSHKFSLALLTRRSEIHLVEETTFFHENGAKYLSEHG